MPRPQGRGSRTATAPVQQQKRLLARPPGIASAIVQAGQQHEPTPSPTQVAYAQPRRERGASSRSWSAAIAACQAGIGTCPPRKRTAPAKAARERASKTSARRRETPPPDGASTTGASQLARQAHPKRCQSARQRPTRDKQLLAPLERQRVMAPREPCRRTALAREASYTPGGVRRGAPIAPGPRGRREADIRPRSATSARRRISRRNDTSPLRRAHHVDTRRQQARSGHQARAR